MKKVFHVVAAVIERDGKILIGKRKKGKHLEGKWEFPGGKIEKEETPEACFGRELREEFGVETKAGEFVGKNVFEYGDRIIHLYCYRGEYLSGDFILQDHDEIMWVHPHELSRYDFAPADIPFIALLAGV